MSKQCVFLMVLGVLFLTAGGFLWSQEAVFQQIEGRVEYRASESDPWQAAAVGDVIPQGGGISTGFNSNAVIALGTDSVVTAKALTRLTLTELLAQEDTVNTDLFLDVGRLRAEVNSSEGVTHDFKIRSTQSTASVRGTIIEGDGEAWATVRGEMAVSNSLGQQVTVTKGQSTVVSSQSPPAAPQKAKDQAVQVVTSTKPPRPVLAQIPMNLPPPPTEDVINNILSNLAEVEIQVNWPE